MEDNRIEIKLCIRNDLQYVKEWFLKLLLFKPDRMKLQNYKKGKFISYNEKIFIEEMNKEIINSNYSIFVKDYKNSITCFLNYDSPGISILTATLAYDIFRDNEEKIYSLTNEIMGNVGIVGRIVSSEDYFWQNNIDISMYADRNKSIKDIPLVEHPIFRGKQAVDIKKLPGYEEQVAYIWVGATWKMWFNSSYYQYVSEYGIANFEACYSNEKISDSCRCITLYENVLDYEKRENRRRQWDFKKAIKFEETVKVVKEKSVSKYNDPHMEISNGQFEHGGVKLFTVYLDDNNNSVTKSKASKMKIVEYDQAGNVVWQNEVK